MGFRRITTLPTDMTKIDIGGGVTTPAQLLNAWLMVWRQSYQLNSSGARAEVVIGPNNAVLSVVKKPTPKNPAQPTPAEEVPVLTPVVQFQATLPENIGTATSSLPAVSAGSTAVFYTAAYNGSRICAAPSRRNGYVYTSDDGGQTWAAHTCNLNTNYHDASIAVKGNQFCVVVYSSDDAIPKTAVSADGVTWSYGGSGISDLTECVGSNGSQYCALSGWYKKSFTSSDGLTWTEHVIGSIRATYSGIIWAGDRFCAIKTVVGVGQYISTSTDGVTWVDHPAPLTTSLLHWNSIAWNGSVLCLVGANDCCAVSSDSGGSWVAYALPAYNAWAPIVTEGSVFRIAAGSTVGAMSSDNGQTWSTFTMPNSGALAWQRGVRAGDYSCFIGTAAYPTTIPIAIVSNSPGLQITQEDLDAFNATLDPADPVFRFINNTDFPYLTGGETAADDLYPPDSGSWPDPYTEGVLRTIFYRGSSFPAETQYVVFSFNGKYFDPGQGIDFSTGRNSGQWVSVLSDRCKLPIDQEWDFQNWFDNVVTDFTPRAFFATGYDASGRSLGVTLVVFSEHNPAYVEIISNSRWLNFITGRLDTVRSRETRIKPIRLGGYGDATRYLNIFSCELACFSYAANNDGPPTGGTTTIGVSADVLAPGASSGVFTTSSNPFTLLSVGGVSQTTGAPQRVTTSAGVTEITAPPTQKRSSAGVTECSSPVPINTTQSGVLAHLGLPFEVRG